MTEHEFLAELESVIQERLAGDDDESYTVKLANSGIRRIAQKVGEEGVELALAAVDGDRDETLSEAADLVYHVLVLLNVRNCSLADVARVLQERHAAQAAK